MGTVGYTPAAEGDFNRMTPQKIKGHLSTLTASLKAISKINTRSREENAQLLNELTNAEKTLATMQKLSKGSSSRTHVGLTERVTNLFNKNASKINLKHEFQEAFKSLSELKAKTKKALVE